MSTRVPVLTVLGALLLGVLAWFFLFQPQREVRAELEAETERLTQQQQQVRLEIARLEEIRANEVEVRAALARAEQYIPDGPGQPSVIRLFQLAADASGVEIVQLTFSDPAEVVGLGTLPPTGPGTLVAQIPLQLGVEGGYFQVADFLRRLETELPRAVLVESVSVIEATSPAAFPTLGVTLSGRLFAIVPAAALGVEPEPEPTPEPTEEAA